MLLLIQCKQIIMLTRDVHAVVFSMSFSFVHTWSDPCIVVVSLLKAGERERESERGERE